MTPLPADAGCALPTPGIGRRLASLLYEALLVAAVAMLAGLLYAGLTQQRHALVGRTGLQVFLFALLALYFVWFWSHGGQTVAMKAWRIRLVRHDGQPVSPGRAAARYLASWIWVVPALVVLHRSNLHSRAAYVAVPAIGILAYALSSLLRRDRQFWHDALCGTRLVAQPKQHKEGA